MRKEKAKEAFISRFNREMAVLYPAIERLRSVHHLPNFKPDHTDVYLCPAKEPAPLDVEDEESCNEYIQLFQGIQDYLIRFQDTMEKMAGVIDWYNFKSIDEYLKKSQQNVDSIIRALKSEQEDIGTTILVNGKPFVLPEDLLTSYSEARKSAVSLLSMLEVYKWELEGEYGKKLK
ncbi:hypothetical protein J2T17_004408 [Paenibacillus mucilaginosus]